MTGIDDKLQMLQMISGFNLSQAIRTAAELEVADALADGPLTPAELAAANGASAENLLRLLRALASVGIFRQEGDKFELTPLAEHLRKDHPDTVWPAAVLITNELTRAQLATPDAVRDGVNGFRQTYGCLLWQYLRENPERGAIFDSMMDVFHGHETPAITRAYDFSAWPVIVDIAGGDGDVLASILRENEECTGILFDLPKVVQRTRDKFKNDPIRQRCDFVAGDFFEGINARGELYLMRHIIHDWADAESVRILANIRAVIPDDGRLLIIEGVIEPGNEPFSYKFLDLVMMVVLGGKERTLEQYRDILGQAGFSVSKVIPTATEVSLIEAIPA